MCFGLLVRLRHLPGRLSLTLGSRESLCPGPLGPCRSWTGFRSLGVASAWPVPRRSRGSDPVWSRPRRPRRLRGNPTRHNWCQQRRCHQRQGPEKQRTAGFTNYQPFWGLMQGFLFYTFSEYRRAPGAHFAWVFGYSLEFFLESVLSFFQTAWVS